MSIQSQINQTLGMGFGVAAAKTAFDKAKASKAEKIYKETQIRLKEQAKIREKQKSALEQKWKDYMKDMPINFATANPTAQAAIAKDFLKTRNLTVAQANEILKGAKNGKE